MPRHIMNSNLSDDDRQFLHKFFLDDEQKPKGQRQKVFHPGEKYYDANKEEVTFAEQWSRHREIFPDEGTKKYAYVVRTLDIVGTGGNGIVLDVADIYRHSENTLVVDDSAKNTLLLKEAKVKPGAGDYFASYQKNEWTLFRTAHYEDIKHHLKITFEKTKNNKKSKSYFVQPKFEGKPLNQRYRNGKSTLTITQRETLTLNLIQAVLEINDKDILHLDIKPQNILVDDEMNVKVIDFGISSNINTTECYPMLGTRAWMAPEAMQGRINKTSDVYSLGLVLRMIWEDTIWLGEYSKSDEYFERIKDTGNMSKYLVTQESEICYPSAVMISDDMQGQLKANRIDAQELQSLLQSMSNYKRPTIQEINENFKNLFTSKKANIESASASNKQVSFLTKYPAVGDILIGTAFALGVTGIIAIIAVTSGAVLPLILGVGATVGGTYGVGFGLSMLGFATSLTSIGMALGLGWIAQKKINKEIAFENAESRSTEPSDSWCVRLFKKLGPVNQVKNAEKNLAEKPDRSQLHYSNYQQENGRHDSNEIAPLLFNHR